MMLSEAQSAELQKYDICYSDPLYGMSEPRMVQASLTLAEVPWRGSYLDVGTGRGEMLDVARGLGFQTVAGTEAVASLLNDDVCYALAWDLPFGMKSFDVVSLFDVIEHVLPGDDESVCGELERVAAKAILITANSKPSSHHGVDLHINRRPYEEWDELFKTWFSGDVRWIKGREARGSEMWRVDL